MATDGVPQWLISLGEALGASGGVLWFLVNRYDRLVDGGRNDHEKAMTAVDLVRAEAAEALQAAMMRFETRQEDLRREVSGQVQQLAGRIDAQTANMATRDDLRGVTAALNKLTDRIDRKFDRDG